MEVNLLWLIWSVFKLLIEIWKSLLHSCRISKVKVKPYEQTSTVDVRPVCCECFHSFTFYLILYTAMTAALPSSTWSIWLAPNDKRIRRPRASSLKKVLLLLAYFSIYWWWGDDYSVGELAEIKAAVNFKYFNQLIKCLYRWLFKYWIIGSLVKYNLLDDPTI